MSWTWLFETTQPRREERLSVEQLCGSTYSSRYDTNLFKGAFCLCLRYILEDESTIMCSYLMIGWDVQYRWALIPFLEIDLVGALFFLTRMDCRSLEQFIFWCKPSIDILSLLGMERMRVNIESIFSTCETLASILSCILSAERKNNWYTIGSLS